MERLKLRAWDKKNKVMFDVYQWNRCDDGIDSVTRMIGFNKIETLFVGEDIDLVQYTGKKDIDGEKLFEGDIVRNGDYELDAHAYNYRVEVIEYIEEEAMFVGWNSNCDGMTCKKIGNKFQNPELLQEKP